MVSACLPIEKFDRDFEPINHMFKILLKSIKYPLVAIRVKHTHTDISKNIFISPKEEVMLALLAHPINV